MNDKEITIIIRGHSPSEVKAKSIGYKIWGE